MFIHKFIYYNIFYFVKLAYIIYQAIYNVESALTSSTLISHCHGVHWPPMHGIYSICLIAQTHMCLFVYTYTNQPTISTLLLFIRQKISIIIISLSHLYSASSTHIYIYISGVSLYYIYST